jgi:drug/metabolite transporter (DMT)-like permease
MTAASAPATPSIRPADLVSLLVCSLIWSTTWYAIKHQLGEVPAVISVIYRFGLAAALLFGWCAIRRESVRLSWPQHLMVAGQGMFVFALDYAFVYMAEEHVVSAVVAVIFASLSFVNLILFRIVLGTKAARMAWAGSGLGLVGVAVLSWGEAARSNMDSETLLGIGFAVAGVLTAAIGNLFASKGQARGIGVAPSTAWSMLYGTVGLVIYALLTGLPFRFEMTVEYVGSLVYLSVFGSVVAFLLYYALARSTGYSFASYISALTPPLAIGISALFESARFGWEAAAGLVLVLIGQLLLIRAPKS